MEYVLYFLHYFLHLLFGALFILGFFAITRGWKEIMPNGEYEWKGKVLKGWFIFWFQEWPTKIRVYYHGREFFKLVHQINGVNGTMFNVDYDVLQSVIMDGTPNKKWLLDIEGRFLVRIEVKVHEADKSILFFYREDPNYVFPWWVRDMLAGCITCHSSWLGSICFWVPFLLSDRLQTHLLFNFTGYFVWSVVLTWIAYCISLAFVTTALWKKYM